MSRRRVHDVAVVGAGMVGAATALLLAREGFDVVVVEPRVPRPWSASEETGLRVVALAPSSADLLRRAGLWGTIRDSRSCAYRHMRVWDALAPGELKFDAADCDEAALGWIVENGLVQQALWTALQQCANVAVHCPAQVIASDAETDARRLVLDDATQLRARLVVAADGADSTLRDMAGIPTRERSYAQRAIVANVSTERPHEHTAWQRFVCAGTVAFLPLSDGRSSIVWSVPDAQADRLLGLDDAAFRGELGAAFDFRLGRVIATTPRASFPLRMRSARRYLAPRLALIGDAAHVVHPLAGQGVNLGFRDADELLSVVAAARDAKRDFAAHSNLRRYERRRRSDNTLSAGAFDLIQRVFGNDAMPVAALRGAALVAVEHCSPLKRLFAAHAAGH